MGEIRFPASCLVVLVGPSGSGKTTWAGANFAPTQIVSSDRLRAVVGAGEDDQRASTEAFALLDQIVAARLARRLLTVIDEMIGDGLVTLETVDVRIHRADETG